MAEKKEKYKLLGNLLDEIQKDHISKEDFDKAVEKLLSFIAQAKKKDREDFERVSALVLGKMSEFKRDVDEHRSSLSKAEDTVREMVQSHLSEFDGKAHERLASLKDAPQMEEIVSQVIPFIPSPIPGSPDTPEEVRDKLASLEGDERLDASAIKGLDKYRGGGGAGGLMVRDMVKNYDLSGLLDGVTKTFALPATWAIIGVFSSSFPNAFRPTIDYTFDGTAMTITFTSEIDAGTTLASGQTIIVQLVSM